MREIYKQLKKLGILSKVRSKGWEYWAHLAATALTLVVGLHLLIRFRNVLAHVL
jgi:hypothetical protein